MEWEHGRNLTKSIAVSTNVAVVSENKIDIENEMVYTYDAEGIRTGRTYTTRIYRYAKNNGDSSIASVGETAANETYSRYLAIRSATEHKYVTQNGKVVRETVISGGVTRVLDYIYDESGRPSSVIFKDGTADKVTYYYVLNLQGDVEKIIDADGAVIAQYAYDPWGKILSITDDDGDSVGTTHIGKLNSLRYRGYCSDTETNWYYLQSRYYDPITRRFINADSLASTGQGILGTNMFAYCNNNPISYSDHSGQIIVLSTDATEHEKEQYARAVNYIRSKSELGKELIERLERSEVVFKIVFVDNNKTQFDPESRTIYFDCDCGGKLNDGISVQSPALTLAHEMGHAAQYLDGQFDAYMLSDKYGQQLLMPGIEEANLILYETPIAKELGEPCRENYYSAVGVRTMNNSTHHITKATRSWWYYLNPFHWFEPRTYGKHHLAT